MFTLLKSTCRTCSKLTKLRSFEEICMFKNCLSIVRNHHERQLQNLGVLRKWEIIPKRSFQTTKQNNVHPLIWMLIRPIAKVSAALVGRGVRKWWTALPDGKKSYFLEIIKRNKWKITGTFLFIAGGFVIYYESHVQETPITKRKRFIAFNQEQIKEFAEFLYEMQVQDVNVLPVTHPVYKRVADVAFKLLNHNKDIREIYEKEWSVVIVNSSIRNAFVLPNGQIFMFLGMADICKNDDQLSIVLGHEISHAILNHGAEQLNYSYLLDLVSIIFISMLWAMLPSDVISAMCHWLMNKAQAILLSLPYQRLLETEADEVGLLLCAKACFDVRESSAFWKYIHLLESGPDSVNIEWLSTHPNNETRSENLDEKIPKALEIRSQCKCPRLPTIDPRMNVDKILQTIQPTAPQVNTGVKILVQ